MNILNKLFLTSIIVLLNGCGKQDKINYKKPKSTSTVRSKLNKKHSDSLIGQKAPGFYLNDQNGKAHILSEYKNERVALYFYPKDMTSNCTKQACSIRDGYAKLKDHNIQIFGISLDNNKKHQEFSTKNSLNFPLLSDDDGKVAKQYKVLQNAIVTKFSKRYTFLINEQGIIVKIIKDPDVNNHANQIIKEFSKI